MKFKRVLSLTTVSLLYAGTALAAGASPLAPEAQQLVAMLSGPAALILIACGFVGGAVVYFVGRDLGHAFITLGALVIGGVLCSQIQPMVQYFDPTAIATIGAPAMPAHPALAKAAH
jgi:hypothetical protein